MGAAVAQLNPFASMGIAEVLRSEPNLASHLLIEFGFNGEDNIPDEPFGVDFANLNELGFKAGAFMRLKELGLLRHEKPKAKKASKGGDKA
jgi:hypothetical protein